MFLLAFQLRYPGLPIWSLAQFLYFLFQRGCRMLVLLYILLGVCLTRSFHCAYSQESALIACIAQIPNDGMYQWVPRDMLDTAESYFSILMVDSKDLKTVSDSFLLVGLQSFQPGGELRRRVNSGTKPSDNGKNEGYNKSNSTKTKTKTKTVKSKNKEASKSAVRETSLLACSAVVTKTKYMYLGATEGANTKTKSSDRSESTGTSASLAFYLDRRTTDIPGSSKYMNLGKRFSASNSTSSSKSTFQNSGLKHNYGSNSSSSASEAGPKKSYDSQSSSSGSTSEKGSSSKHSASNSNSKGSPGSESSSSGHDSKGNKDPSAYGSGSKESDEYGHGDGHGFSSSSKSGHESNSTLGHTSTQNDCTLVTSTTIIYVSSSRNTHTQEVCMILSSFPGSCHTFRFSLHHELPDI